MELFFPDHELRFIRIPKNACSSVIMTLGGEHIPDEHPHQHVGLFTHAPERSAQWPAIVVYRDPFERLVSAYLNKIARPSPREPFAMDVVRDIVRERFDREWTEPEPGSRVPVESVSFAEFVRYVAMRPDAEVDQHWRSQSSFLTGGGEGGGRLVFLDMKRLDAQWARTPELASVPLRTFAPHATSTNSVKVERNLAGVPGHHIVSFRTVAGGFPSKDCFRTENVLRTVRRRYAADYRMIERAGAAHPAQTAEPA